MKPDLILLDCDGVIVDTEPATNRVLSNNLRNYGLDLSPQQCIEQFVGGTLVKVGNRIRANGTPLPDHWVKEIYAQMFEELGRGVDTFPKVFDFLDRAECLGIPVCIISNGPLEKMKITLTPHNLWDRMGDRIYSGYTKGNSKPDPGMIIEAMDRFSVQPDKTWMVDDSASGLTAGIRAKVKTFAFVPDGEKIPDVAFDVRIKGFDELLALLNQAV